MVRRSVLFAVCSLFLSVNSQNLLTDFSDQLFETRSWLAGKRNRTCCWFLFYIIIVILLNILNSLFITWHCMSQGCPFTHTRTAAVSISGKDIKPGRPVPCRLYVMRLTHQQLCIFFCPPGAKSWFTLDYWQAARWPSVTKTVSSNTAGSQAIWIYFFFFNFTERSCWLFLYLNVYRCGWRRPWWRLSKSGRSKFGAAG